MWTWNEPNHSMIAKSRNLLRHRCKSSASWKSRARRTGKACTRLSSSRWGNTITHVVAWYIYHMVLPYTSKYILYRTILWCDMMSKYITWCTRLSSSGWGHTIRHDFAWYITWYHYSSYIYHTRLWYDMISREITHRVVFNTRIWYNITLSQYVSHDI